ncbi:hypothetical protein FQN57_005156 [Myotisia sp. PD_48]|nr:hypothetical protein FQN57_005156 [Myotisia sp. PD_48]
MSVFTFNFNTNADPQAILDVDSLLQAVDPDYPANLHYILSQPGIEITVVLPFEPGQNDGNEHKSSILLKAGAASLVLALSAPVTVPLALGAVGFGTIGVGAGTIAATSQALIGNVAAGSFFATCTSAGMGGAGLSTLTSSVAYMGGTSTVAFLAADLFKKKNGARNGDNRNSTLAPKFDEKNINKQPVTVLIMPRGEEQSEKQREIEAKSELQFKDETKFGSMVSVYLYQTTTIEGNAEEERKEQK